MTAHTMMRSAFAVVMLALCACNRGAQRHSTAFDLEDAWVRAAPDSGSTTAAYIRFVNGTSDTVVVSHFSSDDARVVELHQSSTDSVGESRMAMRESLVIAPAHTLVMRPGGYHLMLMGTRRSLPVGKMIRLVMYLSDGAIVSTSARVKP